MYFKSQNIEKIKNRLFDIKFTGSVVVDYIILPGNGIETSVSGAWFRIQEEVVNGRFQLVYSNNGTDTTITAEPQSFKSVQVDIPGEQSKYSLSLHLSKHLNSMHARPKVHYTVASP